jgi:hypothetical protein
MGGSPQFDLTVVVICNDERGDTLVNLLVDKVANLYLLKKGQCRLFNSEDPVGLSIPRNQLPPKADATLYHYTDTKLWKQVSIDSRFTFEFNTPGQPEAREGVLPIFRQTFPYFDIRPSDIDELLEFVQGKRRELPQICQPTIQLKRDLLPAVDMLCQHSLAPSTTTVHLEAVSLWWRQKLDIGANKQLDEPDRKHILHQLKQEGADDELIQLIVSLLGLNPEIEAGGEAGSISSTDITASIKAVFRQVRAILGGSQPPLLESLTRAGEVSRPVLAIPGSHLSSVATSVLSDCLNLPKFSLIPDSVTSLALPLQTSLLVLFEYQVSELAKLRAKGFSGPVLVLTYDTFAILKRKHRVLRFGQGSHDALTIPFSLTDLITKAQALVPMEQENLRFLQNELDAVDQLYRREIKPSLDKLELEQASSEASLEKVTTLIETLRSKTPVACHTVVTIGTESLQIQQHLRQALKQLKHPAAQKITDQENPLAYLKTAFEYWRELVQAAAGENLKSAS